MENSVSDRVKIFVEYLNISVTQFSKSIGIAQSVIATMFGRKTEPSSKVLANIINTYDILSSEWLLTGKGSMLKPENLTTLKQRLDYFLAESKIDPDKFCDAIDMPYFVFRELPGSMSDNELKKIKELYPSLNIEWLMIGEGNMLKLDSSSTQSTDSPDRIKELEEENEALKAEINQLKGENKILRELAGLGIRKDSDKSKSA